MRHQSMLALMPALRTEKSNKTMFYLFYWCPGNVLQAEGLYKASGLDYP